MPYKITVTTTATIEMVTGPATSEKVGQMSHTVTRTNGAPNERYAVWDIESAADEAGAVVAKMAEAAYERSSKPSWDC